MRIFLMEQPIQMSVLHVYNYLRKNRGMKAYHIFFLVLKVIILVQFGLIIINKQTRDSRIYIATEIMFKLLLGLFMEYFLFHNDIKGLLFEDKMLFSFAGGFLMYDACFNDVPQLLEQLRLHKNI